MSSRLFRRVCHVCGDGFNTHSMVDHVCPWCERKRDGMPENFEPIHAVLDHGHLKYIEHWGSDERIIEGARQSTHGGFISWDPYPDHPRGDAGLLAHLWRNRHHGPFEMAGLTIQVGAPVTVFRQWHRHRTQSYDEMSGRYIELPDLDYVPSIERLEESTKASANKQASGSGKNPGRTALESWQSKLRAHLTDGRTIYKEGLELGVSKEVARFALGVTMYSQMWASGNLRNWLHFLNLRTDPHAQWEIRQYALALEHIVQKIYPRTFALYRDSQPWFKSEIARTEG